MCGQWVTGRCVDEGGVTPLVAMHKASAFSFVSAGVSSGHSAVFCDHTPVSVKNSDNYDVPPADVAAECAVRFRKLVKDCCLVDNLYVLISVDPHNTVKIVEVLRVLNPAGSAHVIRVRSCLS